MNDDAPWLKHAGLSSQEVEELRNKKHKLTNYGREQLKKLKEKQNKED